MPYSWRAPMWVMESVASSAIYKEKPAAIVTADFSCGIDVRGKFGFCLQRYWLLGNATRDAQVASSSIVNKKNTAQNPGRMVCGFFFPKEGAFPYNRHIPLLVPHHNHEQAEP